jgi:hypothetical protein
MLRPVFTTISTKIATVGELIAILNQKIPPIAAAALSLVDGANSFATPRNVTAAYLAVLADGFIRADATAGAFSVTLPPAAQVPGKRYTIKKVDATANAVTVDANGAELIDGALTKVLAAAYASVTIQSNGVSWDVL